MSGLEFLGIPPGAEIGDILARLYIFGVGIVALSALVMFTLGGVRYMLAGDRDPSEAKAWMKNAFWGLVLALTSWLILYTINPDLVKTLKLQLPEIKQSASPQPPSEATEYRCKSLLGSGCYGPNYKQNECTPSVCPGGCRPVAECK